MELRSLLDTRVVLVVDDPGPGDCLFGPLLTHAGFLVDEPTADGLNAIVEVRRTRPDVIVIDGDLPVLDGHEVCRRVKAHPDTSRVPIVFVTGMSESSYRDATLAAGADVIVTKPVDPQAFVALVRRVARYQ